MKSFQQANGSDLVWVHTTPFMAEYELRSGADAVAVLRYDGAQATGESAEASWHFRRDGIWRPKVTVHNAGSDAVAATAGLAVMGWAGRAQVQLPDGSTFRFGPCGLSVTYSMTHADGTVLYRYRRSIQQGWSKKGKSEGYVEITPAGWSQSALLLLALLGQYLAV